MVFRRFRVICIGRVVALAATVLLFFYLLLTTSMYATITLVGAAVIYQVWALIAFAEKSNDNLTRFLLSIEFSDFSQSFTSGLRGRSFDELNAAFSEVMSRFRDIRREKEESFRYLQTVVHHVGMGLLAFEEDGTVQLMNTAAKRLLRRPGLRNIEGLAAVSPKLLDRIRQARPGRRDLVTLSFDDELLQLSINTTNLRMKGKQITLVSLQNISSELNEKEMEAWQNLIRVLTHEIKNSLTPIASLAETVDDLVAAEPSDLRSTNDTEDIREALKTIQRRSQGLLQFVDAYRDLTHLPQPEFRAFTMADLFDRIETLIAPQIREKGVIYTSSIEPNGLELTADSELVEQVLINLLMNAVQALAGQSNATITVQARIDDRSRAVIKVTDNGPGIVAEALEKVFVPFYSTKKGGSGIGLSLSRQIMRLHRGDLTVHSEPGKQTTFTMRF